MECPNCGTECGEEYKFCGECGTSLHSERSENNTTKSLREETISYLLDDIFKNYFSKEQLKNFFGKYVQYYNEYEHIEPEVQLLLEKHGIPEIDKPRRENIDVAIDYLGDVYESKNLINIKETFSYRYKNGAKAQQPGNKFLNRSGQIYGTTFLLYEELFNKSDLENSIKKYFKFLVRCRPSFTCGGMESNRWSEIKDIFYCQKSKFNSSKYLDHDINSPPKLYVVYDTFPLERSDGKEYLEFSIYLNKAIPPQKYIDIRLEATRPIEDFNLDQYTFIGYTQNFSCNLKFNEQLFKTYIEENIIGSANGVSKKSYDSLKYTGWILPHSSISWAWYRIGPRKE